MKNCTTPPDFEGFLTTSMGLNADSIGAASIAEAVQTRLAACELGDAQAYWMHLRNSDVELQELIEAVIVGETWFYRDPESFVALARLAAQKGRRRPGQVLRLLSLPCSTGEEPYSMAMALIDAAIPVDCFRIDAVDISTRALAHAERAVYGGDSFRTSDLTFRDRHLAPTPDGYVMSDAVRQQVRFQWANVLADDFLPRTAMYDVVFCRNLLIYFDAATQERTHAVLRGLLNEGSVLFVAPAEAGPAMHHAFVPAKLPRACAFRRGEDKPPVKESRRPRAVASSDTSHPF